MECKKSCFCFLFKHFPPFQAFFFFGKHFRAPDGNRASDFMNSSGVVDSISRSRGSEGMGSFFGVCKNTGVSQTNYFQAFYFPSSLCRDFVFFSVFYNEVLDTIRNGISSKVNPENLVLEINASK